MAMSLAIDVLVIQPTKYPDAVTWLLPFIPIGSFQLNL